MILQEYVTISINNKRDVYRYKEIGYDPVLGESIDIKIQDIPKGNRSKILVKCEYCEKEKYVTFSRYNINTHNQTKKYACSQKCSREKNKETILNRYGVDNISKLDSVKMKKRNTCRENHGVDHPQMSKEIYNLSLLTKQKRYGDKNFNNQKKKKETNLLKYGYEHASQSPDVKIKQKLSMLSTHKSKILKNEFYQSLGIVDYLGNDNYLFTCQKGHEFTIHYKLLYQRNEYDTEICTICNAIERNQSGKEIKLLESIKNIYSGEIITNDRQEISPYELDIYLPDMNIAIEFNGLYWHCEKYRSKEYHLNKYLMCKENGIELIQVWEDDWTYKKDIIISILRNKMNLIDQRILARKCEIKEIDSKTSREFLNQNHIQGHVNSSKRIGLYYENELISVMTFGKSRKFIKNSNPDKEYELVRMCNKLNTSVIGGFSKMFKFFTDQFENVKISSYADVSYFNGNVYEKIGFKLVNEPTPSYYYIIDDIRVHRFNFRKQKLVEQGFDNKKTESQIMQERKIERLWTAGNMKFEFEK